MIKEFRQAVFLFDYILFHRSFSRVRIIRHQDNKVLKASFKRNRMKEMDWDLFSSLTTSIATAALALLTYKYMRELRKQSQERDKREMRNQIYLRLFRSLKSIIKIPLQIEESSEGPPFELQDLRGNYPHLLCQIPEDLLDQVENFDRNYRQYQDSFNLIWKNINELIKQEIIDSIGIQVSHMKGVCLFINQHSRDIYYFIYEKKSPLDWIVEQERSLLIAEEPEIKLTQGSDPHFGNENTPTIKEFCNLYISVQNQIRRDNKLNNYLQFREEIFESARSIIRRIEEFVQEGDSSHS